MTLPRNWSQSSVRGSTRSEPWPLCGCGLTGVAGGDACSRWAPCASRLLSCGLSTWMHHLCPLLRSGLWLPLEQWELHTGATSHPTRALSLSVCQGGPEGTFSVCCGEAP